MKDIIIHCILYSLPVKYMYNIIVRAMEESSDVANARQLYLQARLDTFTWINLGTYNLPDSDIDTEGEYILAAIDNGALAGFIQYGLLTILSITCMLIKITRTKEPEVHCYRQLQIKPVFLSA